MAILTAQGQMIEGAAKKNQKVFLKLDNHNPSMDLEDVELSDGWYLVQRWELEVGDETRTPGGIFYVVEKASEFPNVAKVMKKAEKGCSKADVGDYVQMYATGGNFHDDKKAMPLVRQVDDRLYGTVNEQWIIAVLKEAEEEIDDEEEVVEKKVEETAKE